MTDAPLDALAEAKEAAIHMREAKERMTDPLIASYAALCVGIAQAEALRDLAWSVDRFEERDRMRVF